MGITSIPDLRYKISKEMEKEIAERVDKGETQEEIARDYGISRRRVAKVVGITQRRVGQIENGSNGNISITSIPEINRDLALLNRVGGR